MKKINELPKLNNSYLGIKIKALFSCYKAFPNIAQFWGDDNCVACLFGNKLSIIGDIDNDSLKVFANFLGAKEIESENIISSKSYTILNIQCNKIIDFNENDNYDLGYKNICSSKNDFMLSRLEWLSDISFRRKNKIAKLYSSDSATALISPIYDNYASLGAFGKIPGSESASNLLKSIINSNNFLLYTVAENDKLISYYSNLGFEICSKLYIIE